MIRRFGETVQHLAHTPGGMSERGRPTPGTWGPAEDVENVTVAPTVPEETREGSGAQLLTGCTLYSLPLDLEISKGDRFVVRGVLYEVEGVAQQYRNPFTGHTPGPVVVLKRMEG